VGSATPAASASATAAAIAPSAIVAGGTTAGTTPALTATYGAAGAITWTGSGANAASILTSGAIVPGSKLSGTLTVDADISGTDNTALNVDLSAVTGSTLAAMAASLQTALNAATANPTHQDFAVTVVGGALKIALGTDAAGDNVTKIDAAVGSSGSAAAPTGFTMAVTDGDSISGTLNLTASGSGGGTLSPVVLSGVTTSRLQSVLNTALNGSSVNPDYSVTYSAGTLTISLTSQAATDNITGLVASGTSLAETAPATASIAFTSGDTLAGDFTITPAINGTVATGAGIYTVNLTGLNTTAEAVAAVNTALGAAATDYTVGYANGKLSIAVNAQGNTDGVNSIAIANGTGNNALSQGTSAVSVVAAANTLMGNFTVTPTTGAGAGTPVNVNLQGVSIANLQSSLQTALGSDYLVSYASGTGNLNISVSSTGVAAGVTGFTVAEASQAAASQETPISGGIDIYTSDGTIAGSQNYNVTVGVLSDASVGTSPSSSAMGDDITATVGNVLGTGGVLAGAGAGTSLVGTDLNTQADAEAALATADNAITGVAYQRGQVGANINTLTAASNISSSQTNITAAQNTISATDYAAATSEMSKYEILTQTGISALAQANSTQQMVTKLLQQ
jgi:flagellin